MAPLPPDVLKYIAAPMVNQSDLPYRILMRRHGVTLTYTQMWFSTRVVQDEAYRENVIKDLTLAKDDPLSRLVVVQLAGNEVEPMVTAATILEPYCDAVDINLGCSQVHARDGHYGGYLLSKKDWPLVESIVAGLANALTIPVHAKIRLCNPPSDTPKLAVKLAQSGASVITLHARHVAIHRRRAGPARLDWVAEIVRTLDAEGLSPMTTVISNGNVRTYEDCQRNLEVTGAIGLMVGEALLSNPTLFDAKQGLPAYPDPEDISLEYLSLCQKYPVASAYTIRHHLKSIVGAHPDRERTPYFKTFCAKLEKCESVEDFHDLFNSDALRSAWGITPFARRRVRRRLER